MTALLMTLLGVAVFGFFVLGLRNRPLAIAVLAALLPTYLIRIQLGLPEGLVPGLPKIPSTVLETLFLALFAGWLIDVGWRQRSWATVRRWAMPTALFLLGATVSVLVAADTRAALGIWRAYFIEPFLFFVIAAESLKTERDRRGVLFGFAACLTLVGILAIVQKITGWGIPNPYWVAAATRRVTAFYGYPNAIALFAAPTVVFLGAWVVELFRRGDLKSRATAAFPAAAVVLGLLAILFAVSKGGAIAAAVGLCFLGVAVKPLRVAALAAVIVGCVFVIAWPPALSRASILFSLRDDSGSVRSVIWEESLRMLADHPVFGAGLAGYKTIYEPYHQADYIEIFMYPHNLVLNFWSETGLMGVAGFFWLVGLFFWTVWRARRLGRGGWWPFALAAVMAAVLVHGLVDVPYFKNDLAMMFWLYFALLESSIQDDSLKAAAGVDEKAKA